MKDPVTIIVSFSMKLDLDVFKRRNSESNVMKYNIRKQRGINNLFLKEYPRNAYIIDTKSKCIRENRLEHIVLTRP